MIRIAICDDSYAFLSQAKFMINHWGKHNFSIETFEDGDSLIKRHNQHPFDIIFLDIVMPLLNGIDTAKELRNKDENVKIVFLTSSVEFAIESYSVKASNYLLKPVIPEKLFACLEELIHTLQNNERSILLKSNNCTHRIYISEIEYVEAQGKNIIFSLHDRKTIKIVGSLYTYENDLTIEDGFFKCHRSYIVNIHQIKSFTQKEIITYTDTHIPISRNNQKNFESLYFSVVFDKVGENK